MAVSATILPDPERLHLIRLVAAGAEITAVVSTNAACEACPLCGRAAHRVHSNRVHSQYVRRLADVPWQGVPFRLRLHARRFFCDEPTCPRAIFTERLPGVLAPYARRTDRLAVWLRAVGFA